MARLFHRCRNEALVLGAGAGLTTGAQAAFLGHVFAEKVDFLIVDGQGLVGAELAELGLRKKFAIAAFTAAFAA